MINRFLCISFLCAFIFLDSCINSTKSNQLGFQKYELTKRVESRYTYNSKGLIDTTFDEIYSYFDGQLALYLNNVTLSRYDTNNNLVLEQEYEKKENELELAGERHLEYNKKHQLKRDTQIEGGDIFTVSILEYTDFDSLSRRIFVMKRQPATLEEFSKEDKKNIKYDTSIIEYKYNSLRQQINHKRDSSKINVKHFLINQQQRIEIINDLQSNVLDSIWYKNDIKIKETQLAKLMEKTTRYIFYFNENGDVVESLNYKMID